MAISTLVGSNKWIEIATSSPTSGSTVSFTSIPEYKDLLIQGFNVEAGNNLVTRFNNDTASNYAWVRDTDQFSLTTSIQLTRGNVDQCFQLKILDANSGPKIIDIFSGSVASAVPFRSNYQAIWNDSSVINQIDIIVSSTGSFTSGSIKLYGRN